LLGTSRPDAIGRVASLNGLTGSTLKAGSSYYVPTSYDDATPDEIATGNQLLRSDNARLAAAHGVADDSQANLFAQRLNSGLNIWTGETPGYGPAPESPLGQVQPWWDQNKLAKGVGGAVAFVAGVPFGVGRAAVHAAGDIQDGLGFASKLASPFDDEAREAAWNDVANTGRGMAKYVQDAIADPSQIVSDARDATHQAHVGLDPLATPIAGTLWDEMHHKFGVGANVGEIGANVAATLAGGEILEGLRGIEAAQGAIEAAGVPRYLKVGASPALAEHLAAPYEGMGSHYIPRRAQFPEQVLGIPLPSPIAGQPLPKAYIDSVFNVSKPAGMSRGEFYKYHYAVDPKFYGARLPADVDEGRGWSGLKLGLQRYDRLGRLWHGAPVP
jgi:hypothetical protein